MSDDRGAHEAQQDLTVPLLTCARRPPGYPAPLRSGPPFRIDVPPMIGAVGLCYGLTTQCLMAFQMRWRLACAAAGLRPLATPPLRPDTRAYRGLPSFASLSMAGSGHEYV